MPTGQNPHPQINHTIIPEPDAGTASLNLSQLINILLNPPNHSNSSRGLATIELPWISQVIGDHLVFDSTQGLNRRVLKPTSGIRTHGVELGLPVEYHDWLCGTGGWGRVHEFKIPVARLIEGRNMVRH